MKKKIAVTFPSSRGKKIKTACDKQVYVVLGRGGAAWQNDEFWVMDFWDIPYTFKRFDEARIGARAIKARMLHYKWHKPETVIAKITL